MRSQLALAKAYSLVFKLFLMILLGYPVGLQALKLKRVILATDANPLYLEFWPIVAKTWLQITGLRPTLALVADRTVKVDESLGDVIRFEPLPGIPTSLQAQVIRLLLPARYPNDGCLISDIDMVPLQRAYFIKHALPYPPDSFIVYRDAAYGGGDDRYPMCYIAAKGGVFAEIFDMRQQHWLADAHRQISAMYALDLGWTTDELVLARAVRAWAAQQPERLVKLHHGVGPRVDRSRWGYHHQALKQGKYIDAHLLRPYRSYRVEIDKLVQQLGVKL